MPMNRLSGGEIVTEVTFQNFSFLASHHVNIVKDLLTSVLVADLMMWPKAYTIHTKTQKNVRNACYCHASSAEVFLFGNISHSMVGQVEDAITFEMNSSTVNDISVQKYAKL